MKNKNLLLTIGLLSVLIISCKKDKDEQNPTFGTQGVYVVNEGSFGSGNSSVSFLNLPNGMMTNNIFENANGFVLGDVAQSMTIHNNNGYIIVNNSQKVEVVNINDFKSTGTITGLQGPRYMVIKNGKGYISDWFANEVAVINLTTNAIINHIPTGAGPEQMHISGNRLFVANVGGYGNDSTMTVIDTETSTVISTLQLGLNPNSIKSDVNGKLWVLCGGSTGPDYIGGTADDVAGSLWKINPASLAIELQLTMNSADHPVKLQVNTAGNYLYYLLGNDGYTGKIVTLPVSSTTLNPTLIVNKDFYGFGLDPDNNIIYGGFAPGFSQNGYVFRYATSGNLIDSLEAGIAPNYFVFR